MQKELKIYIDRLKEGHQEKIEETIDPHFLEIETSEMGFHHPIQTQGIAYLASDHLILELKIKTTVQLPCIICNESFETPIIIDHLQQTIPFSSIHAAVFDYGPEIRSAILLKVPGYFECQNGNCPERENIKKYLKE